MKERVINGRMTESHKWENEIECDKGILRECDKWENQRD